MQGGVYYSGMKYALIVLGIVLVVSGALWLAADALRRFMYTPTESTVPQRIAEEEEQEDVVVVAENLSVPWDILFLPDGRLLVPERTGTLALIANGATARIEVPGVAARAESGLLGAVLHPDFAESRLLYLYMTHEVSGGTQNRVVRYRFENDELSEPRTIIEGIPGAPYHDGGRMAFGPDGLLYITTGDAGVEASAQNRESLAGKILRLNDDGSVPEGNPFNSPIYSYGHRNPQGLAWDEDGQLWATEHGRSGIRSGLDELNRIEVGGNYGWPTIEGDEAQEGLISSILHSGATDTWAPASLLYREGTFYWGGLRGEALYAARRDGEGVTDLRAHFKGTYGRIRAVVEGPDGRIYISTSNTDGRGGKQEGDDKIISIDPAYLERQ